MSTSIGLAHLTSRGAGTTAARILPFAEGGAYIVDVSAHTMSVIRDIRTICS
jgi:hypothetical protein